MSRHRQWTSVGPVAYFTCSTDAQDRIEVLRKQQHHQNPGAYSAQAVLLGVW